ncbi:MAG: hypothetical protein SFU91_12535 [Chloroherpetonaceae bacterium]|nr:hypothetical protein [Chloroherpetonaceae bacterium]
MTDPFYKPSPKPPVKPWQRARSWFYRIFVLMITIQILMAIWKWISS